jgi:hypothetical protein
MTDRFVILPIVARPSFHDPAWREQFDREMEAKRLARDVPPPRTRPVLAVSNAQDEPLSAADRHFLDVVLPEIRAALSEEG